MKNSFKFKKIYVKTLTVLEVIFIDESNINHSFFIDKKENLDIFEKFEKNKIIKSNWYDLKYQRKKFSKNKFTYWINKIEENKELQNQKEIEDNLDLIDDFLNPNDNNIDNLKVFLVISIKTFSWEDELKNEFNIDNNSIKKILKFLKNNDMIVSRHFSNLDLNFQQIIKILNASYIKNLNKNALIYVLSKKGQDYFNKIKDDLEEILKGKSSIETTLSFLYEKKKAYQILKNKFDENENENFYNNYTDENGVFFQTQTQRLKFVRNEVKSFLNFKNELIKKENITSRDKIVIYNSKQLKNIEKSKISNILRDDKNSKQNKIGIKSSEVSDFVKSKMKVLVNEIFNYKENKNNILFEKIIQKIKKNKKVEYEDVEDELKDNFNDFLKYIKGKNIFIDKDVEFFFYKK